MPKIEIFGPIAENGEDPACIGWSTRVLMDGQEIPLVRDVAMKIEPDAAMVVTLNVFVGPDFHFVGASDLHVNAVVQPGFVLIESQGPNGEKHYRAEESVTALRHLAAEQGM